MNALTFWLIALVLFFAAESVITAGRLRFQAESIELLRKSLRDVEGQIRQMGWDMYVYLPSEDPRVHNIKMLTKDAVFALAKHLNVEIRATQEKPSEAVIIAKKVNT